MPEQGCLLFCGGDPLFVSVHFTFVSVVEVYNFMIDLKFVALCCHSDGTECSNCEYAQAQKLEYVNDYEIDSHQFHMKWKL